MSVGGGFFSVCALLLLFRSPLLRNFGRVMIWRGKGGLGAVGGFGGSFSFLAGVFFSLADFIISAKFVFVYPVRLFVLLRFSSLVCFLLWGGECGGDVTGSVFSVADPFWLTFFSLFDLLHCSTCVRRRVSMTGRLHAQRLHASTAVFVIVYVC